MTTESPQVSKNSSLRKLKLGVAVAAIAALSFGAGGLFLSQPNEFNGPVPRQTVNFTPLPEEGLRTVAAVTQKAAPAAPPRLLEQGMPFSFADLVEHVSPAVVTVVVDREAQRNQVSGLDDIPAPFRDFFRQFGGGGRGNNDGQGGGGGGGGNGGGGNGGRGQTFRSQAMGSGFIIDAGGYIVTNNHVVEDGKKISVKLPNSREFTAHLVGADKDTDVAVLKVDDAKDLPTVAFGDDRRLRVGDWVVAVGNPFGLGGTVTAGIVSSIGRDIGNGPYTDYIQIDAPINQGNSGGPTFDLSGRVVGMNTAIFSPSGGSVGIGFAIPASVVKDVVDQIRDHGNVARGWLGVQIQSLTPDMASSLGAGNAKGAIVASVIDDSPAAKAGFKQGDVILSLNGSSIDDSRDLTRKVGSVRAGNKAEFVILRDGQRMNLTALIAKRDEQQLASVDKPADRDRNGRQAPQREATMNVLGMELSQLTAESRERYNLDSKMNGVVVTSVDPNSEAADKGFRTGDVIVGVGNRNVRTPADVEQAISDARKAGRDNVLLLVAGDNGQHYVALKIAKG
ncbi:MAG TPA: Do family serine endopeptidase [Micropepsaceae bacterium]|nr:Do family serine endopeptidase [Micropepsaceae bacterium]